MLAVRVRALLDGRLAPSVEDVIALAPPGAAPPHGRHLRRPRRGHHASTTSSTASAGMSPESAASFARHAPRLRQAAETLSQRLPSLLVEAERVAATVAPGVHGRRRTGMGETFWQFRQYQAGDAAGDDRLAPVGPLAPPVRARAGMGGGRERLALVRPLALDGVPLAAPACRRSGSAPSC